MTNIYGERESDSGREDVDYEEARQRSVDRQKNRDDSDDSSSSSSSSSRSSSRSSGGSSSSRSSSSRSSSSKKSSSSDSDRNIDSDRFKKSETGGYVDTERKQSVSRQEAERRSKSFYERAHGGSVGATTEKKSRVDEIDTARFQKRPSGGYVDTESRQSVSAETARRRSSDFASKPARRSMKSEQRNTEQRQINQQRFKKDERGGYVDTKSRQSVSAETARRRSASDRYIRSGIEAQKDVKDESGRRFTVISATERDARDILNPQSYANRIQSRGARKIYEGNSLRSSLSGLGLGLGYSISSTYEFGKNLILRPVETTKSVGTGIYRLATGQASFPRAGRVVRNQPSVATGFILGEVLLAKGGSSAFRAGRTQLSKLRPGYTPIRDNAVVVDGTRINIREGVASTEQSIAAQSRAAGSTARPVSAQRGLFRGKSDEIIVDKPKPSPSSSELERAFFADPRGNLRKSRLGVSESADTASKKSFFDRAVDTVTEPVSVKSEKPQAVYFDDQPTAKIPSDIKRSLETSGRLSKSQEGRLLQQQLSPTGQFQPVGFVSRESEIVLAPGERISGVRKGFTLVDGKKVRLYKGTVRRGEAITDASRSTRKVSDTTSVAPARNIQGSIGRNVGRASKGLYDGNKRTSPFRIGGGSSSVAQFDGLSRGGMSTGGSGGSTRTGFTGGSSSSGFSGGSSSGGFSGGSSSPPPGSPKSGSIGSSPKPSPRPKPSPVSTNMLSTRYRSGGSSPIVGSGKTSGRKRAPRSRDDKKSSRRSPGYHAFARVKGERVRVTKKPQSRKAARKKLYEYLDNTPSASGTLKRTGTKVQRKETKISSKLSKQFRVGKNDKNRIVEKSKYRINSPGEYKGITLKGRSALKKRL